MSKRSLMLSLVTIALVVGCAEQKGRKKDDKKADKADKKAGAAKQE